MGAVVGVFALVALVLRPTAGRLTDRWGRGPVLLTCAGLFSAALLAHLLVTAPLHLLVLRSLLGVAEAGFVVAAIATLADLAPVDRLGAAMSYNSLGLYLGLAGGPVLGELLVAGGGFDAAWLGAAALGLLALLLGLGLGLGPRVEAGPGSAPSPAARSAATVADRRLLAPGAVFVVGLAATGAYLAFAALHARDLGMDGIGPVLLLYGGIVVLGRLALAGVVDRVPAAPLSTAALGLCGLGLTLVGGVRSPTGLVLGTVVVALGVTVLTPAFFRVLMERLPAGRRGAAAATFGMAIDLGVGGGPVVFGLVAGARGIGSAMLLAGLATLVVASLTPWATRTDRVPA